MTSLSRLALLAALTLPATLLAGCFIDSSIGGAPCKPGTQKDAGDGCNTCICQPDGQFACTVMSCGGGGSSGSNGGGGSSGGGTPCASDADCPQGKDICHVNVCQSGVCGWQDTGKCPGGCTPGSTKTADDGCNTCTCQPDGSYACTEIGCSPECKAQDAKGSGSCAMAIGIAWNGTQCVGIAGCGCVGKECTSVYGNDELERCQKEHAGCEQPQPDPCGPQNIDGIGCEEEFCTVGYAWDGASCQPLACGSGDNCSTLFKTQEDCQKAYASCTGPCAPQSAVGDGLCDAYFGYAWNGSTCSMVSGCNCKGADCKELYKDKDECTKAHVSCTSGPCDAQDAKSSGAECGKSAGWSWNGSSCEPVVCSCVGKDCDKIASTVEQCQKQHAGCNNNPGACTSDSDCPSSCQTCNGSTVCGQGTCFDGLCSTLEFPPCAPPSAVPGGKCDVVGDTAPAADGCNTCTCGDSHTWGCSKIACPPTPAYCNSDKDCVSVADPICLKCPDLNSCGHTYCETSIGEIGTCQTLAPSCGDSCASQDIKAVGNCDLFLGWAWLGTECVGLGGCSCAGKDCGKTYQTKDACKAVHQTCLGTK